MTLPGKNIGMIFAAGLGTRLAPFTSTAPKALVPVAGVPMLERVVRKFVAAGITDIVVNVHHFADKVIDFLKSHDNFGANITISDESDLLLDTGGAIVKAAPLFAGYDRVVVHNADILTDFPLYDMISGHIEAGADVSLLVADRKTTRYLYFDPSKHRLHGWCNLKTGQTLPAGFNVDSSPWLPRAFGGVHIINTSVLTALRSFSDNPVFSIIPFYVENSSSLFIRGYEPSAPYMWHDVGTLEKLAAAESALNNH